MKNILLGLVVIIVVGGGVYLYTSDVVNAPTENPATKIDTPEGSSMPVPGNNTPEMLSAVIVSYGQEGYSPASVTVKKGQAVRFINESENATWPASAIHPTHGVYPQKSAADCLGSSFDACRGLVPGEAWEFTFNSVGSWRYHDHMHAQHTGTIIVTE